jgi:hypothetical protein
MGTIGGFIPFTTKQVFKEANGIDDDDQDVDLEIAKPLK